MKKLLGSALLLLGLSAAGAEAALNVVATSTSMEALTREIGGNAVQITTLAPPDRDAHTLQVRPSMMQALRRADLVVAVGAELESGWLPLAISSSANPKLQPGSPGYFEAAAQTKLIDIKGAGAADRAQGDVHPMGNPHLQMDPVRFAEVGLKLAERLGKLDPANAATFQGRAQAFQQAVNARLPGWQQAVAGAPGVLAYHQDIDYLFERLKLPVLGYIEPLPGMPPTASHIAGLVGKLQGKKGVILHTVFQQNAGIQNLAQRLGWRETALPLDPAPGSNGAAYLALIDRWVAAASGK